MRTIIFKIWQFPVLSESFIIKQFNIAIKLGYDAKILVGELTVPSDRVNLSFFEKTQLKDRIIIEDYKIPEKTGKRYLMALLLLLRNIRYWQPLLKYCLGSKKEKVSRIYEFNFYRKIKNTDIFHVQFGTNKHPLDRLKNVGLIKSKLIVNFHGHDLHFPINDLIENNNYYSELFDSADLLIVNTTYLEGKLKELHAPEEKIRIVPVPVDTVFFRPGKKETSTKFKLITVGRLVRLKGQKYGIEAVKILLSQGYEVEYHIVGSGPCYNDLLELSRTNLLEDNVFFHGNRSQTQIVELLQQSDIFLMTSVTIEKGMAESQGLVTAEAQAIGLPVIAFDSGGIKYTILNEETGFLCNERNAGELAEKIELLIKNPSLRSEMGVNAVEFVKWKFSDIKIMKKWEELYKLN